MSQFGPDILQKGAVFLEGQRHKHMTRFVRYFRGVQSVTVRSTIGRSDFEQEDQFGVVHRTQSRDFLIRSVDLVLDGVQTLPQQGDRIVEATDDPTLLYEVMSSGSEPPYRYSDPERITLRIHTKFIGPETSP